MRSLRPPWRPTFWSSPPLFMAPSRSSRRSEPSMRNSCRREISSKRRRFAKPMLRRMSEIPNRRRPRIGKSRRRPPPSRSGTRHACRQKKTIRRQPRSHDRRRRRRPRSAGRRPWRGTTEAQAARRYGAPGGRGGGGLRRLAGDLSRPCRGDAPEPYARLDQPRARNRLRHLPNQCGWGDFGRVGLRHDSGPCGAGAAHRVGFTRAEHLRRRLREPKHLFRLIGEFS